MDPKIQKAVEICTVFADLWRGNSGTPGSNENFYLLGQMYGFQLMLDTLPKMANLQAANDFVAQHMSMWSTMLATQPVGHIYWYFSFGQFQAWSSIKAIL